MEEVFPIGDSLDVTEGEELFPIGDSLDVEEGPKVFPPPEAEKQIEQEENLVVTKEDEAFYNVLKTEGILDYDDGVPIFAQVLSTVSFMFPEDDPIEMINRIYGDQFYTPTSENIPKDEKVQIEQVEKKVKESQKKIQQDIKNLGLSAANIPKLPQEYQDLIVEGIAGGRPFTALAKFVQKKLGVKEDGVIGPNTIKTISTKDIRQVEGKGDTLTDIDTGDYGMTKERKKLLEKKAGKKLSDKEASALYINKLSSLIDDKAPNLPKEYKATLIDTLYNLGNEAINWESIQTFLKDPTEENLQKAILTKIYAGGKSVKGLGRRRAIAYNRANPSRPIKYVEQKPNGDIIYYDENNNIVFKTKSTRPRHQKSIPEKIQV